MTPAKIVRQCNEILRERLGTSPTGLQNFEWGWSEDARYRHPMVVRYPGGEEMYVYRCQCGVDVADGRHGEGCSEVKVAVLKYELRRLLDWEGYKDENGDAPVKGRWLLWRWKAPPPEALWAEYEANGIHPGFYRAGAWEPCYANGVVLCVPNGEPPTLDLTSFCAGVYRERMDRRGRSEEMEGMLREQERVRKQTRVEMVDMLEDRFPMYHVPGKKDEVSFRQMEYVKRNGKVEIITDK
jgi:hypothetical protein